MEYIIGYEETKEEDKILIENGGTEVLEINGSDIVTSIPETITDTEFNNDYGVEMQTSEESVNTGIHFYGETVSQTVQASNMLEFIADIFIQYQRGNLPKTTPEETAELLRKWFDKSILEDVQLEFHEQPVTPVEDHPEQFVCNQLKRQRVDSRV